MAILRIDKILIDQPADSTDHFRDPQIFNFKGNIMPSSVDRTWRKKARPSLQSYWQWYTNWQAVGDLDFANDRTAYMMECPNMVFVESNLSFSTAHKDWIKMF